jgi:hypothetical protein
VPYALKDKEELRLWILRGLGAPIVVVELTEEQLNDCLEDAVRWFSAKKGVMKQAVLQILAGQSAYPLPPEVGTVTDVIFPSSTMDIASTFVPFLLPEQQVPWSTISANSSSGGIYSYWTQALQYIEMGKRIMSAEPDWRQEGQTLYLFGVRNLTGTAVVEFRSGHLTVEQLSERDHDLIKRSSMARAKRILGRIRSKYDGFPTAQGSAQLDGQALLAEAAEDLTLLDEEIANSGFPLGFMVG